MPARLGRTVSLVLIASALLALSALAATPHPARASTGDSYPTDQGEGAPCDDIPLNGLPDCDGGGIPPSDTGIPCLDPDLPCDTGGGGGGGGGGAASPTETCTGTLDHVTILAGVVAQAVLSPSTCPSGVVEQGRYNTAMARAGCNRDTARFGAGDVMTFFRVSGASEPTQAQCARGGRPLFCGTFSLRATSDVPAVRKTSGHC